MLNLYQEIKVTKIHKKTAIVKDLKLQENDIIKIILTCENTTTSRGLYARYAKIYNLRNMLSKDISVNQLVNTLEISFDYDQIYH